ncbi:hypothetical protein F5Y06DRAFT_292302 [Hypoxylon sp. FL0890]|nr:hypothetical protein F5Y06DRAFT_292302 [Hypoxylon sp. FL0890]
MSNNQRDHEFQAIVNAATAKWLAQRSASPNHTQPNHDNDIPQQSGSKQITNKKTAWQATLEALPDDLKHIRFPRHPLAHALAEFPTLRSIEWNPNRRRGSFKPRESIDFCSMMIYVTGQLSPNPCRNCRLGHGPFAHCIVAPSKVLALSALRVHKHACANCTYQFQQKKCINPDDPPDHGHMVRKPTAQSISSEAFATKLHRVRSWSPRSRRILQAEAEGYGEEYGQQQMDDDDVDESAEDSVYEESTPWVAFKDTEPVIKPAPEPEP